MFPFKVHETIFSIPQLLHAKVIGAFIQHFFTRGVQQQLQRLIVATCNTNSKCAALLVYVTPYHYGMQAQLYAAFKVLFRTLFTSRY